MLKRCAAAAALTLIIPVGVTSTAQAAKLPQRCDEPTSTYTFSSVTVSSRPTNVKSAYLPGPGTIHYSKTINATVGMTASASVTAEAGVVLAKASTQLGVALSASRSWTDGFSYDMPVPAGQTRAMQLFQTSRAFYVTKRALVAATCTYKTVYSGQSANAPRTVRQDVWRLVP